MSDAAQEGDRRSRFWLLAFAALGIVFGDIGTSPLYAVRECFHGDAALVNRDSILGVMSLIVWTLTMMITVQYIALVTRADKDGEGGILALLNVAFPERRSGWRSLGPRIMVPLGIFGATLLYGDGMITPAITVISAMEGLQIAAPQLQHWVLPGSAVIIVALFSLQRFGTGKIGAAFGPLTLLWFVVLGVLGFTWVLRNPVVLHAFNPWIGIRYLLTHSGDGMMVLSGVFLTVTGGEALYADMGHFGRRPVVTAWVAVVKPALLLNYLGQGAMLLSEPAGIRNPLQWMTPDWGRIPLLVLATLASVIASQALISGVFSLTMQAVQLGYLPRLRISHTSSSRRGQIYISRVNWGLLAGTLVLVFTFRSSDRLAGAYGVALSVTMFITTLLLFFAATRVWKWSVPRTLAVIVIQLLMTTLFMSANALKFLQGGWVPLGLSVCLFTVMATWRTGRRVLSAKLQAQSLPLARFTESIERGDRIHRVPGTAVFLSGATGVVPTSLLHNLKHNKVLHQRIVFLTIQTGLVPFVPSSRRVTIEEIGPSIWRIVGHYGFAEQPDVPSLLARCAAEGLVLDPMQTSFFLGRETIIPTSQSLSLWRAKLFALLSRNAQNAVAYYRIPPSRVVEFGIQIEL